MHDLKSAFELLGIEPSTDANTVRSAWRALVRSYHPNMAKADSEGANRRLAEINAAFDAVSACTEADVQRLVEERAYAALLAQEHRRRLRAEKQRARQAAYRAALRLAENAKRAKRQSVTDRRPETIEGEFVRLDDTGPDPQSTVHTRASSGHAGRSHISDMASKAFAAARLICAPHRMEEPRSLYL